LAFLFPRIVSSFELDSMLTEGSIMVPRCAIVD